MRMKVRRLLKWYEGHLVMCKEEAEKDRARWEAITGKKARSDGD